MVGYQFIYRFLQTNIVYIADIGRTEPICQPRIKPLATLLFTCTISIQPKSIMIQIYMDIFSYNYWFDTNFTSVTV